MQYFGGKVRIAKEIASVMAPHLCQATNYWEPFVGGASVCVEIDHPSRFASDANRSLISMWNGLQDGWKPPSAVSEEEYQSIKSAMDEADPLTAFVGFGCSFAGKWFGGYARNKEGANYCAIAQRSVLKKAARLMDVKFVAGDFERITPVLGDVVYCDPPYAGTTGYSAVGGFDWERFWRWATELSRGGVKVFVSEYIAPPGFEAIWTRAVTTDIRDKHGLRIPRTEKLFAWGR